MNDDLAGQIRRDLWAVSDLYDEVLEPVRRASGSHVTTTKVPPLPISAAILDARAEASRDLHYWARFILDEVRDINGELMTNRIADTRPETLVRFIVIWVDRLVSEFPDDADNLAREAQGHARRLRGMVMETGARRFPVGPCVEHGTSDMGERVPCAGEIWAVLRKEDDLLPSEIACSLDAEHHWAAREWMQLGRRIAKDLSA